MVQISKVHCIGTFTLPSLIWSLLQFKFFFQVYTPFHEKSTDVGTIAWNALANAGILLGVIAVITVLLILVQ
jgi:hypothetical protein